MEAPRWERHVMFAEPQGIWITYQAMCKNGFQLPCSSCNFHIAEFSFWLGTQAKRNQFSGHSTKKAQGQHVYVPSLLQPPPQQAYVRTNTKCMYTLAAAKYSSLLPLPDLASSHDGEQTTEKVLAHTLTGSVRA